MSQMNTALPLMTQGPDIAGAIERGQQFLAAREERERRNALSGYYGDNAGGIYAGEPNALAGFARHDPEQAVRLKHSFNTERRAEAAAGRESRRFQLAVEQTRLKTRQLMANMDHKQLERERAKDQRNLQSARALRALGDSEAWDRHKGELDFGNVSFEGAEQAFKIIDVMLGEMSAPLSPEGKVAHDVAAGWIKEGQGPTTEADREIARLMESGVPREVAIGIKEGRYKINSDPVTGALRVFDLGARRIIYDSAAPQAQVASPDQPIPYGPANPAPIAGQPQAGANPLAAEPEMNLNAATGVRGAAANAANTVTDALGAGQPFEANANTTSRLESLNDRTITGMAAATAGRPNAYLVEMYQKRGVQPNSILTGADKGERTIRETIGYLDQIITDQQALLANGSLTPSEQSKANTHVQQIQSLKDDWEAFLRAATGGSQDHITDEDRALFEKYGVGG